MHPNAQFRLEDRDLAETLIAEVGFGMVFCQTPDGPRVAHAPLVSSGAGALRFHLSRGNALARHLPGQTALAVVNGPDSYVSPRWYAAANQVPTWNYVAIELEGPVRRLERDELVSLLAATSARDEARLEGAAWTMDKMDGAVLERMLGAITGFELEIRGWRPTFKLSQNKPADERARVIAGLEEAGSAAMAALMRQLAP